MGRAWHLSRKLCQPQARSTPARASGDIMNGTPPSPRARASPPRWRARPRRAPAPAFGSPPSLPPSARPRAASCVGVPPWPPVPRSPGSGGLASTSTTALPSGPKTRPSSSARRFPQREPSTVSLRKTIRFCSVARRRFFTVWRIFPAVVLPLRLGVGRAGHWALVPSSKRRFWPARARLSQKEAFGCRMEKAKTSCSELVLR